VLHKLITLVLIGSIATVASYAQLHRCNTDEMYEQLFKNTPAIKIDFDKNQRRITEASLESMGARNQALEGTIPVVVHVVLDDENQLKITDAIIKEQIDSLTLSFQGLNADSNRIPAAFKPSFAKTKLVFKLAATNPNLEPTNGIVRVLSSKTYNFNTFDDVKNSLLGGSDTWDPTKYYNIWVVSFTDNSLGFGIFPFDPRPAYLHGVVLNYQVFGINKPYELPEYNRGRTLVHETGHFLGLFHIWGSTNNNSCTDTDFPFLTTKDDTPNQLKATLGNPDPLNNSHIVTDLCTSSPPGIMYQNYMDYTDDIAMVMFTNGQMDVMENSLLNSSNRSPLLQSNRYLPPTSIIDPNKGYSITPNPFNQSFTIQLAQPTTPLQYIQLISTSGQVVKTISYGNGTTSPKLTVDLSTLSSGIYIVLLNFSDRKATENIVKQ